ncbi:hypothetical protein VCRA217O317_220006 [Vibrio crassostreae]|nr:hypothetical protein VCRA217O317_220006 [Vibrio crassostreae]
MTVYGNRTSFSNVYLSRIISGKLPPDYEDDLVPKKQHLLSVE